MQETKSSFLKVKKKYLALIKKQEKRSLGTPRSEHQKGVRKIYDFVRGWNLEK